MATLLTFLNVNCAFPIYASIFVSVSVISSVAIFPVAISFTISFAVTPTTGLVITISIVSDPNCVKIIEVESIAIFESAEGVSVTLTEYIFDFLADAPGKLLGRLYALDPLETVIVPTPASTLCPLNAVWCRFPIAQFVAGGEFPKPSAVVVPSIVVSPDTNNLE